MEQILCISKGIKESDGKSTFVREGLERISQLLEKMQHTAAVHEAGL